jgi:hypothetical protein
MVRLGDEGAGEGDLNAGPASEDGIAIHKQPNKSYIPRFVKVKQVDTNLVQGTRTRYETDRTTCNQVGRSVYRGGATSFTHAELTGRSFSSPRSSIRDDPEATSASV